MKKNKPFVSIIVPVHNGIEFTKRMIKSLKNIFYHNYKIIIVDDGSTDKTYEKVKDYNKDIIIIKGNGNLFWSGGVNKGIKHALNKLNTDYILLLNNDNLVEKNFLNELVKTAQKNEADVVSSKVFYENKKGMFYGGGIITWSGLLKLIRDKRFKKTTPVQWFTGMGVLIKKDLFEEVGFFDEKEFPQYYGDSDFALKVYKNGYKILYEPESIIYNDKRQSFDSHKKNIKLLLKNLTEFKSPHNFKIVKKFYKKHMPIWKLPVIIFHKYFKYFASFFISKIRRK